MEIPTPDRSWLRSRHVNEFSSKINSLNSIQLLGVLAAVLVGNELVENYADIQSFMMILTFFVHILLTEAEISGQRQDICP